MAKADGIYRITEVIGTSETSWEDRSEAGGAGGI